MAQKHRGGVREPDSGYAEPLSSPQVETSFPPPFPQSEALAFASADQRITATPVQNGAGRSPSRLQPQLNNLDEGQAKEIYEAIGREVTVLNRKIRDLEGSLKEKEVEREALEKKLCDKTKENTKVEHKLNELKRSYDQLEQEKIKALQEVEQEREKKEEFQNKFSQSQKEINLQKEENVKLKEQLKTKEDAVKKLTTQREEMETKVKLLSDEVAEKEREKQNKEEEYEEKLLEAKLENEKEISLMKDKLVAAKDAIAELQRQLQKEKDEKHKREQEMWALECHSKDILFDWERKKRTVAEAKSKELQDEVDELKRRLKELEK